MARKLNSATWPDGTMPSVEKATHTLLGCRSKGVKLSPAMRLLGVTLLLWEDAWPHLSGGRYGMDYDELADRTSMTPKQVEETLAKLEDVRLVERRTDGYQLTFERFNTTVLPYWTGRKLRPTG